MKLLQDERKCQNCDVLEAEQRTLFLCPLPHDVKMQLITKLNLLGDPISLEGCLQDALRDSPSDPLLDGNENNLYAVANFLEEFLELTPDVFHGQLLHCEKW